MQEENVALEIERLRLQMVKEERSKQKKKKSGGVRRRSVNVRSGGSAKNVKRDAKIRLSGRRGLSEQKG